RTAVPTGPHGGDRVADRRPTVRTRLRTRRALSFVQPHEPPRRNIMKTASPVDEAARRIPDGASLMIGGFMGVGAPHRLIDALVARGCKNLTVIGNDTARPGVGV